MAALIISLLSTVLPGLITLAENKFGGGAGAQKKTFVQDIISMLLQNLAGAGKAPAVSSDDTSAAIEAMLAALKAQGAVPSATGVPAVAMAVTLTGTMTTGEAVPK